METIKADRREVLRYLGYKNGAAPGEEVSARIDACEEALLAVIEPHSASCVLPLTIEESQVLTIGTTSVTSRALTKHLAGCSRVMLFAATLGIGVDRAIQRAQITRMSDAVLYQAIAAAMIENYCDQIDTAFAAQIASQGGRTRSRFSPGYGDLPLELQKDILRILDAPKKLGLTLTDALLMMPSKSVTAVIGIDDRPEEPACPEQAAGSTDGNSGNNGHHCDSCTMTDCPYRD